MLNAVTKYKVSAQEIVEEYYKTENIITKMSLSNCLKARAKRFKVNTGNVSLEDLDAFYAWINILLDRRYPHTKSIRYIWVADLTNVKSKEDIEFIKDNWNIFKVINILVTNQFYSKDSSCNAFEVLQDILLYNKVFGGINEHSN